MYHQHFGLREPPFSIAVNPRYLFMSPRHRDALAHLLYGVSSGGGFVLLTGEVGTGKTTVTRCFLEQLPDTVDIAIILNPALSAVELLATACDELSIDYPRDNATLKSLTDALHRFLLANHQAGRKTVLMIDEAQHLDVEVLEQVRLLTNLETHDEKLLQIFLIGQPELGEKLARPELRQLNQRITARYHLEPLDLDETEAYIRHRLKVAGLSGQQRLFSRRIVRDLHRRTRGIPRLVNLLCDRALLGAYGGQQPSVSQSLLRNAAAEVLGEARATVRNWRMYWLILTILLVVFAAAVAGYWWASTHTGSSADAATSDALKRDRSLATSALPDWLRPGEEIGALLWQLAGASPPARELCPPAPVLDLQCAVVVDQTWEPLALLDRPVWLVMRRPDGFAAATLLLAMDGIAADVIVDDRVVSVPLAELASYWHGEARYLWRVPEAWARPLSRGDTSSVVAAVARMFAEIDGRSEPVANTLFNDKLETRVKLFQRSEGLLADGVIGMQTLQRLNRRMGVAVDTKTARRRLPILLNGG